MKTMKKQIYIQKIRKFFGLWYTAFACAQMKDGTIQVVVVFPGKDYSPAYYKELDKVEKLIKSSDLPSYFLVKWKKLQLFIISNIYKRDHYLVHQLNNVNDSFYIQEQYLTILT